MCLLGINAAFHDPAAAAHDPAAAAHDLAAAVAVDGKVVAAAEEKRHGKCIGQARAAGPAVRTAQRIG